MQADKVYCASSYLMYRTIADRRRSFSETMTPRFFEADFLREPVASDKELEDKLRKQVQKACTGGAALALSGGIDSAVLAKFMPKGATAYTFQCRVPGKRVTDEVPAAGRYAEACGLRHEVIPVYWEDFENFTPLLMRRKGAPIHSIEVQIYKAALRAKQDGFSRIIFGESADINYGGLSGLLSRDWSVGEFLERYAYVMPYRVLKIFEIPTEPVTAFETDGRVDVHEFCRHFFFKEGLGSYTNACDAAGVECAAPYAHTFMGAPLDLARVRAGENKYWIRKIFKRLYPGFPVPVKTPMPRPMNEWLADWAGPRREEFWPHCTDGMTGDQKWLVWCLERFLDLLEEK